MAGRRRATGRPRQEQLRTQRRLIQLQLELERARSNGDRVAAASDFLRGALKHTDPAVAATVTDDAVRALIDAGTRAFAAEEGAA